MHRLHVSPEAMADMDEIKRYIETELENPDAARSTLTRIAKGIRSLIENPDRGAPLSACVSVATEYRYLIAGNYLVFYRRDGEDVYVSRVLYRRRDHLNALFGKMPD